MTFLLISRQQPNFDVLDFIDCRLIQLEEEVEVMKSREGLQRCPISSESRDTMLSKSPLPQPVSPTPTCVVPALEGSVR